MGLLDVYLTDGERSRMILLLRTKTKSSRHCTTTLGLKSRTRFWKRRTRVFQMASNVKPRLFSQSSRTVKRMLPQIERSEQRLSLLSLQTRAVGWLLFTTTTT